MRASTSTTILGLAAALAAAAIFSPPAHGQTRRSSFNDPGVTMILGSSQARLCYEHARDANDSRVALETCDAALRGRLSPHDEAATLANRSIVRAQRGELAEALADVEAALEVRPEMPAVHMNLGDVLMRLERWREAEDAFTRALALGFGSPQRAHFARAIAREESGDLRGAYDDFATAARLAPGWLQPKRELERFVIESVAAG